MTETTTAETAAPNSDLRGLNRLIGTWQMSGDLDGRIRYEWMDGGFFLLQHVDFLHDGRPIKGIEVIGHERAFGSEPSAEIRSRFYDNEGNTLDYVYELEGDTLTIWGGMKGSPSYFRGTLLDNDTVLDGAWVWPGGGYPARATKIAA